MMIYQLQVHFTDKLTACNLDFLDVSGTQDLSNLGCNHQFRPFGRHVESGFR